MLVCCTIWYSGLTVSHLYYKLHFKLHFLFNKALWELQFNNQSRYESLSVFPSCCIGTMFNNLNTITIVEAKVKDNMVENDIRKQSQGIFKLMFTNWIIITFGCGGLECVHRAKETYHKQQCVLQ